MHKDTTALTLRRLTRTQKTTATSLTSLRPTKRTKPRRKGGTCNERRGDKKTREGAEHMYSSLAYFAQEKMRLVG